jgi:D-alanyl-D-alanine carboxypeptidase/D-alanyl-D-alanine-endopeptidase (penicillin-binding protein 4)
LAAAGCAPLSRRTYTTFFADTENRLQDHVGFVLYDPATRQTIYSHQDNRYFTPASNTKIFTLFAGLSVLGDSIPALRYFRQGDSLVIAGTGDPSFLYRYTFSNARMYEFLKNHTGDLYLADNPLYSTALGPGWAWSDYQYAYSVERSALPMYGNFFSVQKTANGHLNVQPSVFKKYFWLADSLRQAEVVRDMGSNRVEYFPGTQSPSQEQWDVPFVTRPLLLADLLADTLKRRVTLLREPFAAAQTTTLYSVPSDSVYKTMMVESDNFIAEQVLLLCAGVLSDSLQAEITIRHMMQHHLADLPDKPRWVDGSGLSRYNLFTPRSVVALWEKIYRKVGQDRLFALLAVGGRSGTLKNVYKNDPPFIFGKTGTLSNNHSLSGFLVTEKGRVLIFSFMNNNFTTPVSEVRTEMEKLLRQIYHAY